MPTWNHTYHDELKQYFDGLVAGQPAVATGRTAPALDDLSIGGARKLKAAVLFFDIRSFTKIAVNDSDASLLNSLTVLNTVIPICMRIVTTHGGYVEKNTGDGFMAVFVGDDSPTVAVDDAEPYRVRRRAVSVSRSFVHHGH